MASAALDEEIVMALGVTCELTGTSMSKAAARAFCMHLAPYPKQAVLGALVRCQKEVSGFLKPKDVIERLDDGRPGPEEAWGSYPRDEYTSAMLTNEIAEAMGAVGHIGSDRVAGRMAFKEAYQRIVQKNRDAGKPVEWFFSPGRDPGMRAECLAEAVRLGRVSAKYALGITAPEFHPTILNALPQDERRALAPPPPSVAPVDVARRAAVREMIANALRKPDEPSA